MRSARVGLAALGVGLGGLVAAVPAHALDGVTEVCRFEGGALDEISGMTYSQRHPGVIYLHNDSGGGPRLYAIDAATCRTVATLTLAGAEARDFEAIGSGRDRKGRPVVWVGDIGDNLDSWSDVRLLRFREPKRLRDRTVSVRTFRVTYPDRPHNAEALVADPSSLRVWVVTKQAAAGTIYAMPKRLSTARVNVGRPVGTVGGMVTDGAVSPDGSRFALRDYVDAQVWTGRPPGRDPVTVYLPLQLQGEAMTWTPDGSALLVASERDDRLLRVAVTAAPVAAAEAATAPASTAAPGPAATASVVPEPAESRSASAQPAATEPTDDGNGVTMALAGLLIAAAAGVIATAEWLRRRRAAA